MTFCFRRLSASSAEKSNIAQCFSPVPIRMCSLYWRKTMVLLNRENVLQKDWYWQVLTWNCYTFFLLLLFVNCQHNKRLWLASRNYFCLISRERIDGSPSNYEYVLILTSSWLKLSRARLCFLFPVELRFLTDAKQFNSVSSLSQNSGMIWCWTWSNCLIHAILHLGIAELYILNGCFEYESTLVENHLG